MSAQVTAMGIRDGDPSVLQALVDRRGAAVLAFCEHACAPSLALDAAADAFVRFRAQVLAADRPGDINPEVALLSATRHAAAARAPRPPAKGGATSLGRLLGGNAPTGRLPDVPNLLAARADGSIAAEDEAALESLLGSSPVARSIEQRFAVAEDAYRNAPRVALPEPISDQIVATMGALAAAPGNGSAPPEPMTPPELVDPLPPAPRFFQTPPAEEAEPVVPDPFADDGVTDPFAAELQDESVAPEPEPRAPQAESPALFGWTAPAEEQREDDADLVASDSEPDDADLVASDSEPELAEDDVSPTEALAAAEVELAGDQPGPGEPEPPVDVDAAVPDSAEIAATRADDVDPSESVEWSVPSDELGEPPELEREIAAARLSDDDADEDPAHLQSASGAVPEDDVSVPSPPVAVPEPPALHAHRHGLPGRAALAPAAAVVAVAAIGAMAASGVFGGNDPSPAVDTGIVPERALQAVPEGEAAAVVDDLRAGAADARRRRLADQRRQLAAQQATPDRAPEETSTAPGGQSARETPEATGGGSASP